MLWPHSEEGLIDLFAAPMGAVVLWCLPMWDQGSYQHHSAGVSGIPGVRMKVSRVCFAGEKFVLNTGGRSPLPSGAG